jgi:two-component system, OmpR family, sensor kinase
VSRVPIRWRLTAAFALAMVLVLAAAAWFVYVRLQDDLTESVEGSLHARAAAVSASGDPDAGVGEDTEESFAQVVSPASGRMLDSAGGPPQPALDRAALTRASAGGDVLEDHEVSGIEGTARVLAVPGDDPRGSVVIVGQSLDDRDETLAGLVASFAVGGPIAVVAASLLGYLLAASALRPVEAMRRRAGEISLGREDDRLPLPVAHDEIRRLGMTLNEMLARMRDSYERERRFVADASHELRTPLAVLKAELEGTLRREGLPAETRESLAAALAETDQLAQLADDLLLIARSGDKGLEVNRETVNVRGLLEQARHRFSERAGSQGRAIELDAPPSLEADLDPLRLRQAIGNLVDNALRHGSGPVELSARSHDGAVEIDVSDEGAGFPAELATEAFERFTRGDSARTRGGAGLGLAIVSAIAGAHGGSAEILDGEPGRTIVRLRLPQLALRNRVESGAHA